MVIGGIESQMGSKDDKKKDDKVADKSTDKKEEEKKEEPKKEEPKKEEEKQEFGIGDTQEVNGIKITLNSVRIDEGFVRADDGFEYFVADITVENTRDKEFYSNGLMDFNLKDGDSRQYSYSIGVNTNGSISGDVPAGDMLRGDIAFEVPVGSTLKLIYSSTGVGGSKVTFTVR